MLKQLLIRLANMLESWNIQYCILHGWETLPEYLPSDLDLIISPRDLPLLESILRRNDFGLIVQLLQHESTCFYFVVGKKTSDGITFLLVDAATDYRRNGMVYFCAEELLKGRLRYQGFQVAGPESEFAYLLVKKVCKGRLPEHQKVRLQKLQTHLGDKALMIARQLFGMRWGGQLIVWLMCSDWANVESHLSHLKRVIAWQVIRRDPLNLVRYWFPEIRRIWQRWRYPTGLFVAVLGPDGAGKSTLIQQFREDLGGAFRRTEASHWRPSIIGRKRSNGPVTDPHGKPAHTFWLSCLKVPYYVLDYVLGYLITIRRRLAQSTLVLYDRYYDDLLVDPRRYRYGGPKWLLRLARPFVPRPDLYLILDVPANQLLARKQEVSQEELQRQRRAYQVLARELPNVIILNGSLPAAEVAQHAHEVALDYLYERYLRRRSLWIRDNGLETLHWLESFMFIPEQACFVPSISPRSGFEPFKKTHQTFGWLALKDGRGYMIPLCSRQARINALSLYNAQSPKARAAKKLLTLGVQWGFAKSLMPTVQVHIHENVSEKERAEVSILEHLKDIMGNTDLQFSISLGTPGLHRKPVVQMMTKQGHILGYAKVGRDATTNTLVQTEVTALQLLNDVGLKTLIVPQILYSGCWHGHHLCVLSAPQGHSYRSRPKLTPLHFAALQELQMLRVVRMPLQESAFWERLGQCIGLIKGSHYRCLLEKGMACVEAYLGQTPLAFHFSHGDFAAWNMLQYGQKLFIFDWEYSSDLRPPAFDTFHFLFTSMFLLKRLDANTICNFVVESPLSNLEIGDFLATLDMKKSHIRYLWLLYFLERLAFNINTNNESFKLSKTLCILIDLISMESN